MPFQEASYEVICRGDRLAQFEETELNEGADTDALVRRLGIGTLLLPANYDGR